MTKKIAVSVPDDVAERLSADDIDNVSAYITEAVRRRMRGEETRRLLKQAGFDITDEGVERWRQRLAELDARHTPEERAAAWRRVQRRVWDEE
jgi:hypothetical protein